MSQSFSANGGHKLDSTDQLSATCQACGLKVTMVALITSTVPPCPGHLVPPDPYATSGTAAEAPKRCECGAHKTYGSAQGQAGHSSWCPWA